MEGAPKRRGGAPGRVGSRRGAELREVEDTQRPAFILPSPGAPGRQCQECIVSLGFESIQKPDRIPTSGSPPRPSSYPPLLGSSRFSPISLPPPPPSQLCPYL